MDSKAVSCFQTPSFYYRTLPRYGYDVVWRHLVAPRLCERATNAPQWHVESPYALASRHFFLTLRFLSENGSGVSVRSDVPYIMGPLRYRNMGIATAAFRLEGVRFVHHLPSETTDKVLIFDSDSTRAASLPWSRRFRLRYDISTPRFGLENYLVAPYPMHPLRYISGDDHRLPALRDRRRNIRVLFAGNMDERKYASPFIRTLCRRFGYLTRYEAFSQLINSEIDLEYIASFAHLKSVMERENNSVVLVNSMRYDIPQSMWMDVLARADFFLAFPGVWMPMCHNAIEAMAVGTIPVLMYNDWFHPPLVDGRDCLRLKNGGSLVDLLRDLASLPASTISCMKRNVIDYYEQWLSPASFIHRVKSHPASELTLFFNYEEPSEMEKVTPESVIISC